MPQCHTRGGGRKVLKCVAYFLNDPFQQQHGHKGRKFYFKLLQKMKFWKGRVVKEIASKFNQENVFDIRYCVSKGKSLRIVASNLVAKVRLKIKTCCKIMEPILQKNFFLKSLNKSQIRRWYFRSNY